MHWDKSTSNYWDNGSAGWNMRKIKISDWSLESCNRLDKSKWSSYLEALTSISEFNVNMLFFPIRFLGSTKIPLRDLTTGRARSLPSRNVPLVNESGQNIGVGSADMSIQKLIFLGEMIWTIEHATLLFQATIDLMIGYDPPANAAPNLNDPDAGDATVDTGMLILFTKRQYSAIKSVNVVHFILCLSPLW